MIGSRSPGLKPTRQPIRVSSLGALVLKTNRKSTSSGFWIPEDVNSDEAGHAFYPHLSCARGTTSAWAWHDSIGPHLLVHPLTIVSARFSDPTAMGTHAWQRAKLGEPRRSGGVGTRAERFGELLPGPIQQLTCPPKSSSM